MTPLTLALDWTPNINHIGFFIAQEQGFYREQELDVTLLDPGTDDYATTPAKKVELGQADLALCPTESVISYRTKDRPFPLIAIAALLQDDLSAIAVRADSPITGPRDLDGKTYASYAARYEDEIVREMVRHDGGSATIQFERPSKLGIWDTLRNGTYDATWVFTNWEGVEAEEAGVDLRYFRLKDYDIPYSYSPVIAAGANAVEQHADTYRRFLTATKQGYMFTQENPGEAVGILRRFLPARDHDFNLKKALKATSPFIGDPNTWGRMDTDTVNRFLDWLRAHGLESRQLAAGDIFTNALIP